MRATGAMHELVLLGGGHAHVQVLKSFGERPVAGVRLTLVAREIAAPYSGMLPGLVAGHYRPDECHIDLARLARFAAARLVHDEAIGIDRGERRVLCRAHPSIGYDLLSIDIGATPSLAVPGAAGRVRPVKPIDGFARRWDAILERLRGAERPPRIVVVGGGAGGVEIALAAQHRLRRLGGAAAEARFTILTRGKLLARHAKRVRRIFRRILAERGIAVETGAEAVEVAEGAILRRDGRRIDYDEVLWTTEASAAGWLAETGLALDSRGFVAVDAALRSISDPLVFAAGDIAAVLPHPREKAGVYAVRQGPPLAGNLRRVLAGTPPLPFRPQRRHLSLITTGDKYAVASRGPLALEGAALWRLKDWIDRRWMRRYHELPEPDPAR